MQLYWYLRVQGDYNRYSIITASGDKLSQVIKI